MAYSGTTTSTTEVKTGKGIGPVTTAITLSQAVVGLVYVLLTFFGVVLPVEVLIYGEVITAAVVGYLTKGRAYVKETTVFQPVPVGTPTNSVGDSIG